tara:strand:- start:1210 stop:1335 length:126 start_codon:yes stop_codon:yes gene_type:complete
LSLKAQAMYNYENKTVLVKDALPKFKDLAKKFYSTAETIPE